MAQDQPREASTAAARRERLIAATVAVAGERGWEGMTLGDVVAEAGLSKRAVYDLFDDKETCFLAAAQDVIGRVTDATVEACRKAGGRRAGLRAGVGELLRFCADEPLAARVYLVETAAAGSAGAALWREHMEAMSGQAQRALDGEDVELPPHASVMAVGGVYGLAQTRVVAGEGGELPTLAPAVSDALMATLGLD